MNTAASKCCHPFDLGAMTRSELAAHARAVAGWVNVNAATARELHRMADEIDAAVVDGSASFELAAEMINAIVTAPST